MTRQASLLDSSTEAPPRLHDLAAIWANAGRPVGSNPRRWLRMQDPAMTARVGDSRGKLFGDDLAAEAYRSHLAEAGP